MRNAFFITAVLFFYHFSLWSQPTGRVEVVLNTTPVLVDTIKAKHLYGIGRPTDQMGEIFIWDNAVFVAAVTPDTKEPFVRRFVKDLEASFLLSADVPEWDTFFIRRPVHSLLELEKAIDSIAAQNHWNTNAAYPFLMIGKMKSGKGDILFKNVYQYAFLDKRAQMVGFVHGGLPQTMTNGTRRMRIHFRLQNKYHAGVLTEADFDETEPIKLLLPH